MSEHTRRLLREEGGLLYSSDAYNDDLPYWLAGSPPLLIIPYTLVNNDARYLLSTGFASGDDFFMLLKDGFDQLWHEGARRPKMMSVGLHGRISGHPARALALARFLDYVQGHDAVWICRTRKLPATGWPNTLLSRRRLSKIESGYSGANQIERGCTGSVLSLSKDWADATASFAPYPSDPRSIKAAAV